MVITDSYIRSVGKFESKGRYYSSSTSFYYIGTDIHTNLAYFTIDLKPVVGDYLFDYSTNTGYFVGAVLASSEAGRVKYYEVVLLTVNNSVSLFRFTTINASDNPTIQRKMIAAGIPCILRIEWSKPAIGEDEHNIVMKYCIVMQDKYCPKIGDTILTPDEHSLTVVGVISTDWVGLTSLKAYR